MRKIFVIVCLVISIAAQAQNVKKIVVKSAVKGCWAALISEDEAKKSAINEYGWWSAWHRIKQEKKYKLTPATFTNIPKGKYIIVIYNPASQTFDPNAGIPEQASDGAVMEEVDIQKNATYNAEKADFKVWNCLSCPWLYVWNGEKFLKQTEVIKDIVGKAHETTTSAALSNAFVVKKQVKIRIQEEKDEISYLNRVVLKVGNKTYLPTNAQNSLQAIDHAYHTLKKGEMLELTFVLDNDTDSNEPIVLETTGYYEPETAFLAEIYQKYLKTK